MPQPHHRRIVSLVGVILLGWAAVVQAGPVRLAWDASTGPDVAGYLLSFGTSAGTYTTTIDVGNVTTYDLTLPDGFVYYIAVRAYNSDGVSDYSNEVAAWVMVPFEDDPLGPGVTPVKVTHILELRARVGALRAREDLAPFAWRDASLAAGALIRKDHVVDLRTALVEVYAAMGLTAPAFTDPVLVAGVPVRAIHFAELRNAVKAIE